MLKMASSAKLKLLVYLFWLCRMYYCSSTGVQVHLQLFAFTQVEEVMTDAVNVFSGLLPNLTVTSDVVTFADSTCDGGHEALAQVLQTFQTYGNSSILIGPTCSLICETVGLIAAKYDIVLISPACVDIVLTDKRLYPTFLRTRDVPVPVIVLIRFMLKQFSWRRLGLIVFAYPIYLQHTDLITQTIASDDTALYINIIQLADPDYGALFTDLSRILNSLKHQTRGVLLIYTLIL